MEKSEIEFSKPLVIYTIAIHICMIIKTIGSFIGVVYSSDVVKTGSVALKASLFNLAIWILSAACLSILTISSLKKQKKLLQNIYDLHENVKESMHWSKSEKFQFISMCISSFIVFSTIYGAFNLYTYYGTLAVIFNMPVLLVNLINTIYIVCFHIIIYEIMRKCEEMLEFANLEGQVFCIFIETVKINEDFNAIFSFHVLSIVLSNIMALFVVWYQLSCLYILKQFEISYYDFQFAFPFLVMFIFMLFSLSCIGSFKYKQSDRLLLKVTELSNKDERTKLRDDNNLSAAIKNLPLHISGVLFNVNFGLFINILAFITSYLVFFIQFQTDYNYKNSDVKINATNNITFSSNSSDNNI